MITQKQIDTRDEYIKRIDAYYLSNEPLSFIDSRKLLQAIADADEEAFEHCTAPDITYCKAEIGKTECGRNCKWYKERIAEN